MSYSCWLLRTMAVLVGGLLLLSFLLWDGSMSDALLGPQGSVPIATVHLAGLAAVSMLLLAPRRPR